MELYLFNKLNKVKSFLKSFSLQFVMKHYLFVTWCCSLNLMKHNLLKDDRNIIPQKGSKSPKRKVEQVKPKECGYVWVLHGSLAWHIWDLSLIGLVEILSGTQRPAKLVFLYLNYPTQNCLSSYKPKYCKLNVLFSYVTPFAQN